MKYSELIEEYKNGKLDEKASSELKNDIEKHEAISDYLAERDEGIEGLPELSFGDETEESEKDSEDFSKKIKKQIRRAFLRRNLITTLVALAAALFCIYLLPKIIDRAYYDPAEIVGTDEYGVETNRISLDLAVYSELFLPGNYRQKANPVRLGSGRYSISIPQEISLTGYFRDNAGIIERGRLTLFDPNLLKLPEMNVFQTHRAGVHGMVDFMADPEPSLESLIGDMRDGEKRMVFVTFKNPMSYDETLYWFTALKDVTPLWGAVCTGDEVNMPAYYGMRLSTYGRLLSFDEEKYPALSVDGNNWDAAAHIASLLKYAADNEEAMKMFSGGQWNDTFTACCRESAEYILQNGFSIYGVAFVADSETISEIYTAGDYSAIYVKPVE